MTAPEGMWLSQSSVTYLRLNLKKTQKRYAKKTPAVKKILAELQEQSLMLLKVSLLSHRKSAQESSVTGENTQVSNITLPKIRFRPF